MAELEFPRNKNQEVFIKTLVKTQSKFQEKSKGKTPRNMITSRTNVEYKYSKSLLYVL
ncbi:hypothetical protein CROQUDRAFT_654224 [Cronartium quercuum f. sp. fusiforme G11]|uniref:Uncharacterized protein n=1 Tax=Cronartium quercuum f. sp. fusiforme G11 TaxID=708437 RepID=A0A9P6NKT9_9BASI|nr:hypothetical protein CROQUDRAFT_654224 [Cronartium quercuum f. sp. fusiforme G11]